MEFYLESTNCLVSVIIPTYNRGNIIKKTVESVLNQTYQNFEIIIVDDLSDKKDITEEVIKQLNDNRIKYIKLNKKVFGSEARNIGVRSAVGKYVAFLDSDDEWIPNKLEKFLSVINNIEGKYIFYSSAIVKTRRINDRIVPQKGIKNKSFISYILADKGAIYTPTIMLKRDYALEVTWNKTLKRFQDFGYYIDFQNSGGDFYFIDDPLSIINWRRSGKNNATRSSWKNGYTFWLQYHTSENIWDVFFITNIIEELIISCQFSILSNLIRKHRKRNLIFVNFHRIIKNCIYKFFLRNLPTFKSK